MASMRLFFFGILYFRIFLHHILCFRGYSRGGFLGAGNKMKSAMGFVVEGWSLSNWLEWASIGSAGDVSGVGFGRNECGG